jgi:translation initiation factor IF-2
MKLPEKVDVYAPVRLKDLSGALGIKAPVLVKQLFEKGKPVTINQYLDDDTIVELGVDLGTEITVRKKEDEREEAIRTIAEFESATEDLVSRAPVVTFLGHVDHGKTSLLDKIRTTNVTSKEEGGITQHLGAYRVDKGSAHVTFIDTPGHKAFTEMRARGANVTDIAVLVVAADDGPMPQTEEAINHARAAEVPIVVAVNKIDRPNANPQRCKEALSQLGLMPTEWNGTTEFVEVSAITGEGIDALLEVLSLEAEILELKANPKRPAVGVVLEAEASGQRGVIATVLVQDGTLRVGGYMLCGPSHGRIRSLILNGTEAVEEAGPSVPVQVVGLGQVPAAGEKLYVFENEKQARELAEDREIRDRESERVQRQQVTLENLFDHLSQSGGQELRLIIKADVRGSIEALTQSLQDLSNDEVKVAILHSGVGAISQEDIHLASASQAVVIGFHVTADGRARILAEENHVDIRHYRVIYEAIEDVKAALEDRLAPEISEEIHGRAEIRQVYKASKIGTIAGCVVADGHVLRSDKIRLIRDGTVIYTGELNSLKRFKDDVKEVKEGYECGIKLANYEDIKVGDFVEGFAMVETQRNL